MDKFTKSRAVGQVHRDNERVHMAALERDIQQSKCENILLFALFAADYKKARSDHYQPTPIDPTSSVRCSLPSDRPENPGQANAMYGTHTNYYKLSKETAAVLGQTYISSAIASVLLELIIFRRNIVADDLDVSNPNRRRRRRSSYRMGTSAQVADQIMNYAVRMFAMESPNPSDLNQYVAHRMGSLAHIMERWTMLEQYYRPAEVVVEHIPPLPSSRPRVRQITNKRSEGAKRCSRCNMLKFTGSGHGRSKCDDGYSISSHVPYPVPNMVLLGD